MGKKHRVLIAKIGLDGHDRAAKIIAKTYMEAGMDVIYTGRHQTPDIVAETALQEDVDIIGISILTGAHINIISKLNKSLKEREIENVIILVGGIIPNDDIKLLKDAGVSEVFTPGCSLEEIVCKTKEHLKIRETKLQS